MTGAFRIEPLRPETTDAAARLIRRILQDEFPGICIRGDLDDLHAAYSGPGRAAWTVCDPDTDDVVGTIAVTETDGGSLKVKRLYVDAGHRRMGLGRALLETAHAWAGENGYQHLVLTTTDHMDAAVRMYTRYGYRESHEEKAEGTAYRHFALRLGLRALGTTASIGEVPPTGDDGALPVVIERPRRLLEGWHHEKSSDRLVLTEYYGKPVPVNYGFCPLWENPADGDLLDVIVLDDRRMAPGEALVCRPAGVLWRPDGDHKLLAEPADGAVIPLPVDDATRARVETWWGPDNQPTGWGGPDQVTKLLDSCIRIERS